MRRPARFVLNADVVLFFVFRPMPSVLETAATFLPLLSLFSPIFIIYFLFNCTFEGKQKGLHVVCNEIGYVIH
jgi:Na+-driven multidrug efflux pump